MPVNDMGITNASWGVCGFTSSFYAMHELKQQKRPQLNGAGSAHRVLAEIKTYLNILKADGQQQILDSIRQFTRSFGAPYDTFTVDNYIARVNDAVNHTEEQILGEELFGIAMPPAAVADYLKRIWDSNSSVSTVMGGNGGEKDGILGVTSNNPNMPMYNGLEHYLFRHNGVVYSWGEQFNDIAHAAREGAGGANWQVCRFIEVH